MKKLITLVLVLIMTCMMIPAMAEEDVSGEWYTTFSGVGMIMHLNADGTASIEASGSTMVEGTWKAENGAVTITAEDGTDELFEIKADGLYSENLTTPFTRDPENAAPAIAIAEIKADAELEDFAGVWNCKYASADGVVMDMTENVEAAGLSEIPTITIEGSAITATGLEIVGITEPMEGTLENGVLIANTNYADMIDITIKMQVLQDGMMALNLEMDGEDAGFVFYFVPATAEEAPAA